jgi:hypothetical protein
MGLRIVTRFINYRRKEGNKDRERGRKERKRKR